MLDNYKKVLVTGGAGFIGGNLVKELIKLNKNVIVFDNLSTGKEENLPHGTELIVGDLRNKDEVLMAMKDIDLVFHVGANANGTISVRNVRYDFETNVLGTFNVLEATLNSNIKKLVYISSASVYGKPQTFPIKETHPKKPFVPYGASKLIGEVYCNVFYVTYSLPVVIGRPFCVYGPGENPKLALVEVSRYLRWALNDKPINIIGDMEKKTRDFVHVNDVIKGLLLLAEKASPGEVYNIGSGQETSVRELSEVIGFTVGKKPRINMITNIEEDTYRLVGDISKLKSLGYMPEMTLAAGINALIKHIGKKVELPGGATIFKTGQK